MSDGSQEDLEAVYQRRSKSLAGRSDHRLEEINKAINDDQIS